MKFTGITVLLIGAMILIYCGIMGMQAMPVGTNTNGQALTNNLTLPIIFGLLAVVGGALLLMFGGRGYFRSDSLAVRN